MLFKVTDHNNKFIQYASLCVSNKDLSEVVFFNSNMLPKLRALKSGVFKSILNCSFNQYSYKSMPVKIECYLENAFHPYYLDEMPSFARQMAIDEYKKRRNDAWSSTWAPSWSMPTDTTWGGTGSITFTYTPYVPTVINTAATTAATVNTANTMRVQDGYHVGQDQRARQ